MKQLFQIDLNLKTWLHWLLEYTFGGKLSHFPQDL